MEKKYTTLYISLIFLNFLNFFTYGLPITYFPNVAKIKGLYDFEIGLIFSAFPMFSFIFGFVIGKYMSALGRANVIKYSQISLGISTLIFGFSSLIPEHLLFMLITFISRGVQGLSMGAYQTAAYSYIPEYWPNEIDKRIIIMEIFLGFGIGMGPLVGAAFYEMWGYISIFIIPSILISILGFFVALYVLPDSNEENLQLNKKGDTNFQEQEESLSITNVFIKKDIIYIFVAMVFVFTCITLIMPEFENKVISLGETPEIASCIYFFQQVGYILSCIYLFCGNINNQKILYFFSLLLTIISLWLFGFDAIISFNNQSILILMCVSFFILGLSTALSLIPFISANILILKREFPNSSDKAVNNMSAGLFNGSIALAEFSGPIFGGILCDLFGFSKCCLLFSGICLLFLLMFTFHWKGYKFFSKLFGLKKEVSYNLAEIQLLNG